MSIKPLAKTTEILIQELENELLVYDLKTNKAFVLNQTSAIVFQLCDGKRTVAEISQTLNKKLKQPISEDLIWLALDSFKKDNLLEESESFAVNFNGLTRRQVIKKVGLASMIALPLVSSVVAPSAAMAQSLSCTSNPTPPGCPVGWDLTTTTSTCSEINSGNNASDTCTFFFGGFCSSGKAGYKSCDQTPESATLYCICL